MNFPELSYQTNTILTVIIRVGTIIAAIMTIVSVLRDKKRHGCIFLVIAVALALIQLNGDTQIKVPDVTGYYYEDARLVLIQHDLKYAGLLANDSIVDTQDPAAGEIVPAGTVVELFTVKLDIVPGNTITFGQYEQDNNFSNGTEPIDWLVLDVKEDGQVLVISKMALDCQPYHASKTAVTWESSTLRQWLNGVFYNTAFDADERAQIELTEVTAEPNPYYNTTAGSNTNDKLFLLSLDEVSEYLPYDSARICNATQYAIKQGAYVNPTTGGSWWWLRSPGISSYDAASINSDGSIDYDDGSVDSAKGTVRPAMWIRLS